MPLKRTTYIVYADLGTCLEYMHTTKK